MSTRPYRRPARRVTTGRSATTSARRLATRLDVDGERLFPYADAESIFNEHRESTRGRDLDITGLSYARLDRDGPQQWPYAADAAGGTERLYADGVFPTADGKGAFRADPACRDGRGRTGWRVPDQVCSGACATSGMA